MGDVGVIKDNDILLVASKPLPMPGKLKTKFVKIEFTGEFLEYLEKKDLISKFTEAMIKRHGITEEYFKDWNPKIK